MVEKELTIGEFIDSFQERVETKEAKDEVHEAIHEAVEEVISWIVNLPGVAGAVANIIPDDWRYKEENLSDNGIGKTQFVEYYLWDLMYKDKKRRR